MRERYTPTGLSIAIKDTINNVNFEVKNKTRSEFTIKIANTLEERENVFQLAYEIYLEKKFIRSNDFKRLIHDYDQNKETIILMVQDQDKKLAGSLTLVFNESSILPAEKIYNEEINTLKMQSKKLVEISRLVISHEYRNSKEVLRLLINYLMIYSYHVKNYSSLIVQVNPRHTFYYKSLLNFEEIGTEKACPSVQNAPAILLHLPLQRYQSEIMRFAKLEKSKENERSMYAYFLKPEQEKLVAHYLKNQIKPMNAEEKFYFRFTESGKSYAVFI